MVLNQALSCLRVRDGMIEGWPAQFAVEKSRRNNEGRQELMTFPRIAPIALTVLACVVGVASLMAQTPLAGILRVVDTVPNVPGARCGHHLELTVLADTGKIVVVRIFDPKISSGDLKRFWGKKIEVDLLGETVVQSIRLAAKQKTPVAALESLSTRKPC
jgi:hypothetical protein